MLNTQDKSEQVLELYRAICRFNFFKDLDCSRHQLQVNLELDELPRSKSQQFQDVPVSFASTQNYINFWKPLFIEELKGYIASSLAQAQSVEKFDLHSYFELGSFKIMEFKKVRQTTISYSANSLTILSPNKPLGEDKSSPHLVGVTYKVEDTLFVRVILGQGSTTEGTEAWKVLTTTKQWYLQAICPLASVEREYKALSRFGTLQQSIRETLLKPHQSKQNQAKMFVIPEQLDRQLKEVYNKSQYEAIWSSLKQEGVTLIQGPPGTGKTKTVLGTLSVLLQSSTFKEQDEEVPLLMRWKTSEQQLKDNTFELNPWMRPGFEDWRDQPYLLDVGQELQLTKSYSRTTRTVTMISRKEESTAPSKVLVCGPSNASVDEVIRKLIKEQLLNGTAGSFLPKFVRIGENYHEEIKGYSLDVLSLNQQKKDKTDVNTCKKKILKECQLVFSTLSAAGSGIIENSEVEFDTVVIDEAGQAVEISNLIPLLSGCKRLILIGDPKQLPATVFSPLCLQHRYDQSLFERLMKANYPVSMLRVQYRMHPQISKVVGSTFYEGLLEDGLEMHSEPRMIPRSFLLLHVETSSEIFGQQSFYNPIEGQCVKILVDWLSKKYQDIGVLSPYSAQIKWLNNHKVKAEAKTIDSFQGREKQVIIFSAVRAARSGPEKVPNKRRTIGFVGDGRRLNVALSRAREACIVVGDLERLQMAKVWRSIISEARKSGNAFKVVCVEELRQMGQGMKTLRKY